MEIAQFLRLTPRKIVGLAVLAMLLAAPVTALLLRRPLRHQATATVNLATFVLPNATDDEHARVLDDYGAALTTVPVLAEAASVVPFSPAAIRSGVAYVTPEKGYLVQVKFTNPSPERARQVVRTVSTAALRLLAQQAVDTASASEDAANRRVAEALGAYQTFEAANGPVDVMVPTLTQELQRLRNLAAVPGQASQAATIARQQTELIVAVAAGPEYARLSSRLSGALAADQDASRARLSAEVTRAGVASGSYVAVDSAVTAGHLKSAALTGFTVDAVAVLLAIFVMVAVELRTRSRALGGASRATGQSAEAHLAGGPAGPPFGSRVAAVLVDSLRPNVVALCGLALLAPVVYLVMVKGSVVLGTGKTTLALLVAVPLGLAAGVLAVAHFDGFLVLLLVIRSSLDTLNPNGFGQSGRATPADAVGAVFIVAGGLWLAAQWRSERWVRPSAPTWWLWAFASACLLSVPTSVNVTGSLVSSLKVIAGVLMFSVLEQYLARRPERARVLVGCVLLSLTVPALVAVKQWAGGTGIRADNLDVGRVEGTFTHPSTLATYLLLVLPLCIVLMTRYKGLRRLALGAVALGCTGLILLTYTRAAWAGALLVLVYLGIRGRRQILWLLLAGTVVVLVAVPSVGARLADLKGKQVAANIPTNSLAWRLGYWERIIPLANGKQVTGIGFDGVQYVTPEQLQPHNGFVEAYVETGVVGFVAIVGLLWSLAVALRRRLREAAPGWERLLALVAVAAAIGLFVQFPSENLLAETIVYWYAAAVMTYGLRSTGTSRPPSGGGPTGTGLPAGAAEEVAPSTGPDRPALVGAAG